MVVVALGIGELSRIAAQESTGYRERNLVGHRYAAPLRAHLWNLEPHELLRHQADRPRDRRDLATVHGEVGSSRAHWMGGEPQAWWHAVVHESRTQPLAARPWFWEGVGRNVLLRGAISVDTVPATYHAFRDRYWTPSESRAARLCFGMGLRHTNRGSPSFQESWRALSGASSADMLPSLCAGVAAAEARERYGLRVRPSDGDWRRWIPGCRVPWLATGIGMQLARETRTGSEWPPGEPQLSWWFGPTWIEGEQEAFRCGYELERALLEQLESEHWQQEHDLPDPLLTCLTR